MSRKNINGAIHGDRSDVRAAHGKSKMAEALSTYSWDKYLPKPTGAFTSAAVNKYVACHENHPALALPRDLNSVGKPYLVYGGNCSKPVVSDADTYIGFEHNMHIRKGAFPWNGKYDISFHVPDMGVPVLIKEYISLVDWTRNQIILGRKIHCGCIGGHGRTGMFLAALVSRFGEPDAITYTREHYCHKAVESTAQGEFLHKHFGVTRAKGSKEHNTRKSLTPVVTAASSLSTDSMLLVTPLPDRGSIWGPKH